MCNTVFLVRHGVTEWHQERRVLGQRDLPLNAEGVRQAQRAAQLLESQPIADLLSSPLQRCVTTAEHIAGHHGLQPARDVRLTEFQVGPWTGMTYGEVARDPLYQRFLADPLSEAIPGGETLVDILKRSAAAVDQALAGLAPGKALVIVTHAGIIRVLLTHYLGAPPANYHLLRVSPGSISILRFDEERSQPRVLAVNYGASFERPLGASPAPDGSAGEAE